MRYISAPLKWIFIAMGYIAAWIYTYLNYGILLMRNPINQARNDILSEKIKESQNKKEGQNG